jgi:hypothetical protein
VEVVGNLDGMGSGVEPLVVLFEESKVLISAPLACVSSITGMVVEVVR